MSAAEWVAAISAGAAVAAVVVSAMAIVAAVKGVRDQMRVSIFVTYTERYSQIMADLPFQVRRPSSGFRLEHASEAERITILAAFREYMNLCSQEMWLHSSGGIDEKTWRVWVRGMKEVARFPDFPRIWQELSIEYNYFREFRGFMQGLVEEVKIGYLKGSR